MRTNRRVRSNGKPVPSKPQAESPRPALRQSRAEQAGFVAKTGCDRPFDESFDHPSCLCIYDRVGRAIVSKVIGEDEFYSLHRACGGGKMESLIAEAVREKVRRFGRSIHRVGDTRHSAICLSTVVSEEEDELVQAAVRERNRESEEPHDLPAFIKAAVLAAAQKALARDPQSSAGNDKPAHTEMLAVADRLSKECAKTRYLMESLLAIAHDLAGGEDLRAAKDALDGFGFILDEHMASMKRTLQGFDHLRSVNNQDHPQAALGCMESPAPGAR